MKPAKQTHVGKQKKSSGDWHVSHTSMGMGDYYGQAIKNPIGKIRDAVGVNPLSKAKLKKPPKSLA